MQVAPGETSFERHLAFDVDELPTWTDPVVVAARYHEMLVAGHESICESLAILTDPEAYPAMLHCSAGKDRTGILSAIILGVLGVADEMIVDDYALSGPAMVRLVDHLQRTYPDARERLDRVAPALMAAEPESMQRFLASFRAEHGSFEGYLSDLGMASAVPYLRANCSSPESLLGSPDSLPALASRTCTETGSALPIDLTRGTPGHSHKDETPSSASDQREHPHVHRPDAGAHRAAGRAAGLLREAAHPGGRSRALHG